MLIEIQETTDKLGFVVRKTGAVDQIYAEHNLQHVKEVISNWLDEAYLEKKNAGSN